MSEYKRYLSIAQLNETAYQSFYMDNSKNPPISSCLNGKKVEVIGKTKFFVERGGFEIRFIIENQMCRLVDLYESSKNLLLEIPTGRFWKNKYEKTIVKADKTDTPLIVRGIYNYHQIKSNCCILVEKLELCSSPQKYFGRSQEGELSLGDLEGRLSNANAEGELGLKDE